MSSLDGLDHPSELVGLVTIDADYVAAEHFHSPIPPFGVGTD